MDMGSPAAITRRRFLQLSAAGAAVAASGAAYAQKETRMPSRPNIVVIYLDDLGYGDLACYGSPVVKSPNLDGLTSTGIQFTNWYTNAPVCSASRASLMTGQYPTRTGITSILGGARGTARGLKAGQATIAGALKKLGYRTAAFGKWHLGTTPESHPLAQGFDEFFGFLAGCVDYYSHIFYWGMRGGMEAVHDLWENEDEVWYDGQYLTDVIGQKAVQFIERQDETPWFLYLPFNAPHYPLHAPQHYIDRYPEVPEDRRVLAAMVSAVDDAVGAVIDALKRRGMYDNTLIFFSSDNGPSDEHANWLNGRTDPFTGSSAGPFRGYKASLFDGGIHMPALMHWPAAIPPSQVSSEVCATMDVFPTLLEAAGGDPGEYDLDGRSVLAVATQGNPSPHERVFWDYNGQGAVREGKWKLVLDGKEDFQKKAGDAVHLSDLETDPGEQKNLKDEHPDVVQRLTDEINAWRKAM